MLKNELSIIGIDIGGTKCSVVKSDINADISEKITFETTDFNSTLDEIYHSVEILSDKSTELYGISCGGPLDEEKGVILSPPNLPGWDRVAIVKEIESRFGGKAWLMNDANAGALAEWLFGCAKNCQNVIFLTCGTGMGAGMIINGKVYNGSSSMAGEAGHIRLEEDGPWGFGKKGSFEGFCSGGGIAQLGKMVAEKSNGNTTFGKENIDDITARDIAAAAFEGDAAAKQIFTEVGFYMGRAVAILIDIINPEMIIIGSIYQRCRELIEPRMRDVLEKEALEASLKVCRIVPSSLGEKLGDFAAVAVAKYNYKKDV